MKAGDRIYLSGREGRRRMRERRGERGAPARRARPDYFAFCAQSGWCSIPTDFGRSRMPFWMLIGIASVLLRRG
jgi:hypothetical protein